MNNLVKTHFYRDSLLRKLLGINVRNGRHLYLSYLQTDELVRVVDRCEEVLYGLRRPPAAGYLSLYWDIRADALIELRGRQLELFKAPPVQGAAPVSK